MTEPPSDPRPGRDSGPTDRSPAAIRAHGNHLRTERSVYLRQHAHNPIDWHPWSDEALERSRREDRPIFLSIGYSSCHWCHVMEHEVFAHDDVAEFMNENFVSIKVDREERPDLDAVYMGAVQAMNDGQGGWPMSVFLTPDLKPFFGGTYFPHDHFLTLARGVIDAYRNRRDDLAGYADHLTRILSRNPETRHGHAIDARTVAGAAESAAEHHDPDWGGYLTSQKFPTPARWLFLLRYHRKTGDGRIARIVRTTLDHMGSGGIQDHVGGGFHRYTVDATWTVPHFEKMLYDNAQIAGLYLEASSVFDEPRYAEIARDTLDFLIRDMSGAEGGLYGSYDADSGGEEGSYYVWSPDELVAVAGPDDGRALARLLDVTEGGNFEGKSVLTRRIDPTEAARSLSRPESEIAGLFDRWRKSLREHRDRRPSPGLDRKIVTSWNGLAISALARGAYVLGEARFADAARAAAEFLWRVHREGDRLHRASTDGVPTGAGILDDYAFLADGLIDLHRATGELTWLTRAVVLLECARALFAGSDGGYYLTPDDVDAPLGRRIQILDSVEPSGNAVMVRASMRAALLTGREDLRNEAERAIAVYWPIIDRARMEMAAWLDAALRVLGPTCEVVIAGDPGAPEARSLIDAFHRLDPAHAELITVPAAGPTADHAAIVAPASGKTAGEWGARGFVCTRGACQAPTSDPSELRTQILAGWKR